MPSIQVPHAKREIETKFLEIDTEKIVPKIIELGGKEIYNGRVLARYYDYPDDRLRNEGKKCRLRFKEAINRGNLTYKEKIDVPKSLRVRASWELEDLRCEGLEGYEGSHEFLLRIGMRQYLDVSKERLTFMMPNGMRLELDRMEQPKMPPILEIEGPMSEEYYTRPIEEIVKMIRDMAEQLGLSYEHANRWSTRRLIEHYDEIRGEREKAHTVR